MLAMVWVQPLDLTGRISVATTQVRLPRPRLKAMVKIMRRGRGSQESWVRMLESSWEVRLLLLSVLLF